MCAGGGGGPEPTQSQPGLGWGQVENEGNPQKAWGCSGVWLDPRAEPSGPEGAWLTPPWGPSSGPSAPPVRPPLAPWAILSNAHLLPPLPDSYPFPGAPGRMTGSLHDPSCSPDKDLPFTA